ncbi:protein kinase domain-containing protein [Tahibacter harae]|uniref:Serine/threonine-protein kinase n=1 Tax=Tahibacter harae TaxID=2963937 RepID=A0ABT1QU67_9GAMM|nr:protein kinase [Tahibacter harae]MCQ4165850.1 serine/threonine-protein kinase [Tahibacter harae]
MDAQRWRRARELFDELIELPREQWQEQLLRRCGGDAGLEHEVRELLAADAGATTGAGLPAQAPAVLADIAAQEEAAEYARLQGQRVGPFRLLRPLGRGGMGAVWLAERADGAFRQQVAVKLIRSGWDAEAVMARFQAERQILAGLQHPHIAHLIDGGVTADGKPWLALEYVDGGDIASYCDRERLGLDRRLALFTTVCAAVAHAHARLVVHRDLKPSNILVSADGTVKLLDFGIAKLIDPASLQVSGSRVFTPEYAAPEQLRGEVATISVDIYALGLLLYELLTGRRPYRAANSTPAAYERAILDHEPTRPSQAVVEGETGSDAQALAQARDLSPRRLRQQLRGDLDAIVLKALRKDPAQRYATVGELLADIAAYQAQRPVAARRGNWRYRARRFVARHALATGLAVAAVLALCLGLGLALWQAEQARQQRDLAVRESARAQRTADFLADLFTQADPNVNQGKEPGAGQLLDAGADQLLNGELDEDPHAKAGLLLVLAQARRALGGGSSGDGLIAEALRQAERSGDALLQLETRELHGAMLGSESRLPEALALLQQVHAELPADDPRFLRLRVRTGIDLSNVASGLARDEDTERYLREAYALQQQLPDDAQTWRADAVVPLAFRLIRTDRAAEAETMLRQALAAEQAKPRPHLLRQARISEVLGMSLQNRPDLSEALEWSRRALELKAQVYGKRPHGGLTTSINNYGVMLMRADRVEEALPQLRRALELRREQLSPEHGWIAQSLYNYGRAQDRAGDLAGARASLEEAKALLIATDTDKGRDETAIRRELGSIARRQQRWDAARAELDLALERFRALPRPDAAETARTLAEREMLDAQSGSARRDCAQAREAQTLAASASRINAAERAFLQIVLAGCLADTGAQAQARALFAANAAAVRATPAYPLRQQYLAWVEQRIR